MESPFASQSRDVVSYLGQTVTIQKLSGKDLEAAQFAHMSALRTGRGRNWAQLFVKAVSAGTATEQDARQVAQDPLAGYDRIALVRAGVKAWTFTQQGAPVPVTPAAIDDLDDEALETLASAILRLTKPDLFVTSQADADTAQKNA